MCGCLNQLFNRPLHRRGFLAATGATLIADQAAAQQRAAVAAPASRTRLVLLGTAGGPTYWANSDRVSTSSALFVGDAVYMIDCGDGASRRLRQALEVPADSGFLRSLRALFLTHLHSDHTVDYPSLLLYGGTSGLDLPGKQPLHIYGPGRRGQLEPIYTPPGKTPANPGVVAPANPTPGTVDLTDLLVQAFATDVNDRIRDNGRKQPGEMWQAHDIAIPATPGFRSPNETPSPDMQPFKIFEDDRVRVSAILVNHAPIWPAFAFRFDTDDGSVVFSGDTGPCANLITLARDADILVHEVIVTRWIDGRLPSPRSEADEGLRNHLLSAHTPVEQVGKIAQQAHVGMLVLNHLVPGNARAADLFPAQKDFAGPMIIGDDLLQIGVRRRA